MVTLYRGPAWRVTVYGREHGIPHFHIEGPGYRCTVSIATLERIVGVAPPSVVRAAGDWARENRAALLAKWRELNG
jgi:hypothetical protein